MQKRAGKRARTKTQLNAAAGGRGVQILFHTASSSSLPFFAMCSLKVKHLVALAVATAVLSVALYAFGAQALLLLLRRTAAARMATDTVAGLGSDTLTAVLCGAGSPFPDDRRSGPCTLVVAGTRMFVFDSGAGSTKTLQQMGFNAGGIEAIYLTHFHSDHIDGLGQLLLQRWVTGPNTAPVPVHGPRGVEAVVSGFVAAYAADQTYRTAHHGDATVPASGFGATATPFDLDAATRCGSVRFVVSAEQIFFASRLCLVCFLLCESCHYLIPSILAQLKCSRKVVLSEPDLEITAFEVEHPPVKPNVAYKVTYKGRSLVLSGDTVKSAAIVREATGVDLLLHEALSTRMTRELAAAAGSVNRPNLKKVFYDIEDYHTTPEQAAEVCT